MHWVLFIFMTNDAVQMAALGHSATVDSFEIILWWSFGAGYLDAKTRRALILNYSNVLDLLT